MSVFDRLKSYGRSLLRPLWDRVWRRIEIRIRAMDAVEHVNGDAWQQHMPAFLNAVSTVGAFGHELQRHRKETLAKFEAMNSEITAMRAQLEALAARHDVTDSRRSEDTQMAGHGASIECARRQLISHTVRDGSSGVEAFGLAHQTLKPRIVSADKFVASRLAGLRLNLGCGHAPLDGYVNVDTRDLPGVDVIAEAGNLPVEPGTVREIHSVHLLEHFPGEELRRRLLPYWFSLLSPGGTFKAIVSDSEAMLAEFTSGDYSFEALREVLFGAQENSGDYHFNMFLPQSLGGLLEEVGFVNTNVPVRARRNGLRFEFEIDARRP